MTTANGPAATPERKRALILRRPRGAPQAATPARGKTPPPKAIVCRRIMVSLTPAPARDAAAPRRIPKVRVAASHTLTAATFRSRRYRLLSFLGKGGSGEVFKARDRFLGIDVAIKFVPRAMLADRARLARLRQEAGIALQLSHEHIAKLHNLEIEQGRAFLVMEYVDGCTLRRVLTEHGGLALETVNDIAHSCALALQYAHDCGVLHLDLKPENLMLTRQMVLKVVDFGTARALRGEGLRQDGRYIEGTPGYMSPEQIAGLPLDRRTDIYSLGMIIYECLRGAPAFPFGIPLTELLTRPVPPLTGVPDALRAVIEKAIDREPDRRWAYAEEFYEAFAAAVPPDASSPAS